ncbi:hypothetical protein SO802_026232 [Lithocarpus litseifolius]|uniref:Uncharacterized protein n=1 Tax=Lithocarpus litseifolius TaxID=425828 RepID=A0AAW2C1L9_9ROSI
MPGVNLEQAHFHEVVDDDATVFTTDLVKGYGDIHVFVEYLVNEPIELPVEDLEPLAVRPFVSEPEGVNALEVFSSDQQNEDVVYYVSSGSGFQSNHFYEYAEYDEDNDNEDDDREYIGDFSQFGGHSNAKTTNVDHGEPHEVEPGQMGNGVMNSDYESEEMLSLDESSSSSEHCNDSSHGETPTV